MAVLAAGTSIKDDFLPGIGEPADVWADVRLDVVDMEARDETLRKAVAYRKAGGHFYTAGEFMEQVRAAIDDAGAAHTKG